MEQTKNKVLSEYLQKVERAQLFVLKTKDAEAIGFLCKNGQLSDKAIEHLFHFGENNAKELFIATNECLIPKQQVAICRFGSIFLIKTLIDKVGQLAPPAEKILLLPTKTPALHYYIVEKRNKLAIENKSLFFQKADDYLIKDFFKIQDKIIITEHDYWTITKRGMADLFLKHFDKCYATKEALLAVFETNLEELQYKIENCGRLTVQFDVDFVKKYGFDGVQKHPFPFMSHEAEKILYQQDKDMFWECALKYQWHVSNSFQKELQLDENREDTFRTWMEKGKVSLQTLNDILPDAGNLISVFLEKNPFITADHIQTIILRASPADAKKCWKLYKEQYGTNIQCKNAYKKRFNFFQRLFG